MANTTHAKGQYYLKDKKLQLWKFETSKVNGVSVKKWVKATPSKIWAYYRQTGGSKTIEGSALKYYNAVESAIFVVNKRSDIDINTKLLIVYNHAIYEINVVDDYEGNSPELKISAVLAEDQTFSNYSGLVDE